MDDNREFEDLLEDLLSQRLKGHIECLHPGWVMMRDIQHARAPRVLNVC